MWLSPKNVSNPAATMTKVKKTSYRMVATFLTTNNRVLMDNTVFKAFLGKEGDITKKKFGFL